MVYTVRCLLQKHQARSNLRVDNPLRDVHQAKCARRLAVDTFLVLKSSVNGKTGEALHKLITSLSDWNRPFVRKSSFELWFWGLHVEQPDGRIWMRQSHHHSAFPHRKPAKGRYGTLTLVAINHQSFVLAISTSPKYSSNGGQSSQH